MAAKYTEAQAKATKKYQQANKERLSTYHKEYESGLASFKVRMTPEQKEIARAMAEAEGKSLNQFIVDRITMKI